MKTQELRTLPLILTLCLVMQIATVKAQTAAPFTITHNDGSFEFRADGKFVATSAGPWSSTDTAFTWNPALGSLSYGMDSTSSEEMVSTTASGVLSTASGVSSTASGYHSTASGRYATASGPHSTASGYYSTASAYYSTASGRYSTASGDYSTASGRSSTATGRHSTASGQSSTASGTHSTASGRHSTASGLHSTAFGAYIQAQSVHALAIGVMNVGGGNPSQWIPTDPLFEVGNGGPQGWGNPAINARSNAFTVFKNGDADVQGVLTCAPGGDIPMFSGN